MWRSHCFTGQQHYPHRIRSIPQPASWHRKKTHQKAWYAVVRNNVVGTNSKFFKYAG
jgi:hypothetical protein